VEVPVEPVVGVEGAEPPQAVGEQQREEEEGGTAPPQSTGWGSPPCPTLATGVRVWVSHPSLPCPLAKATPAPHWCGRQGQGGDLGSFAPLPTMGPPGMCTSPAP
jgi:hypothetical protein